MSVCTAQSPVLCANQPAVSIGINKIDRKHLAYNSAMDTGKCGLTGASSWGTKVYLYFWSPIRNAVNTFGAAGGVVVIVASAPPPLAAAESATAVND
jgi:uncharacterized membrane protein